LHEAEQDRGGACLLLERRQRDCGAQRMDLPVPTGNTISNAEK
jgi:hypothetical protein